MAQSLSEAQSFPVPADDLVAAFQIEGWPVRGRVARPSEVVNDILTRHDYPEPVANLLGEACALTALLSSSLKFWRAPDRPGSTPGLALCAERYFDHSDQTPTGAGATGCHRSLRSRAKIGLFRG